MIAVADLVQGFLKSGRGLIFVFMAITFSMLLLFVSAVHNDYEQQRSGKLQMAATQLEAVVHHVTREIELADTAIDIFYSDISGSGGGDPSRRLIEEASAKAIRAIGNRNIDVLAWGMDGFGLGERNRGVSVADREYFKFASGRFDASENGHSPLRENVISKSGLIFGSPVEGRVRGGDLVLPVARIMNLPGSGEFFVVTVSILLKDLLEPFNGLREHPDDVIFIMRRDRVGMVRVPADRRFIGQYLPKALIWREFEERPYGEFEGAAATDGIVRRGVRVPFRDYPLVAGFSLGSEALLDEYLKANASKILPVFILTSVALSVIFFCLYLVRVSETARQLAVRLEQGKDQALREVSEALRSRTVLLASASHELKTPLNAIIGFSDIIGVNRLDRTIDPKYQEYAKDILVSAQHLSAVISDLLDLAKSDLGQYSLEPKKVNAMAIVDEAILFSKQMADQRRVTIRVENLSRSSHVFVDKRAALQVILNVLSNAVKYSDEGQQVTISSNIDREKDWLVKITDSGSGISQKDLQNIFVPFYRGEKGVRRDIDGSGLGLSIVKSLMTKIGGEVRIDSQLGSGTVVTLLFPGVAKAGLA